MQLLLGAGLLFISLILSSMLYFCAHLSPLLNMIVNIPIFLLYTVGLALLTWNMYGALGHSCTKSAWGNDDGINICQQYKALYSFGIIAWVCQIALIVLDIRAKRYQHVMPRYNPVRESQQSLKLDPLDHSRNSSVSSVHDVPYGAAFDSAHQRQQSGGLQRAESQTSYHTAAPTYNTAAPTYQTAAPTYRTTPYDAPARNPMFDPASHHSVSINDFEHQSPTRPRSYDNYQNRHNYYGH